MPPSQYPRPTGRSAFQIAIICALRHESNAVEASFDEFWENEDQGYYGKAPGDKNAYTLGRIGRHDVVLVYMSGMGKTQSATASASLMSSFPEIRLGLVVGICGAVPQPSNADEIFLGDVIISTEAVQTDYGRQYSNGLRRKDTLQDNLGRPNPEIRAFVRKAEGYQTLTLLRKELASNIRAICGRRKFRAWGRPPAETDTLYNPTYRHRHQEPTACDVCAECLRDDQPICEEALDSDCKALGCSDGQIISWSERDRDTRGEDSDVDDGVEDMVDASEEVPVIHFGPVASSDSVMKSAFHRDTIARDTKAIAFEMESAGTWDNFPTVVVKAACDYADSHKNKIWQRYAAVSAAATAKALLSQWSGSDQPSTSSRSTRRRRRVDSDDDTDSEEGSQVTFINHGRVANQAANQTIHGGMYFGSPPPDNDDDHGSGPRQTPQPRPPTYVRRQPQQQRAQFHGSNYGSQIGFNSGQVSNNHYGGADTSSGRPASVSLSSQRDEMLREFDESVRKNADSRNAMDILRGIRKRY